MDKKVVHQLKLVVKDMKNKYRTFKADAEKATVRWQWATGPWYSLIPFEHERFEVGKGKLLKTRPKSLKRAFAFGFDDQDRLKIIRNYDGSGQLDADQLVTYSNDTGTMRVYTKGGRSVGKAVQVVTANGLPQKMCEVGSQGNSRHETYSYENRRLKSIDIEQYEADIDQSFSERLEFSYKSGRGQASAVEGDMRRRLFVFDA